MAGLITRIQRYMLCAIIFINGYHITSTIIIRAKHYFLMFETWHPFDNSSMLVLQITNISEIFGSLAIITTLMTFTCLYGVMVCVACSQLEKLRAALLDIKQETSEHEGTFSRMQDQLNACIRHHQEIKRFMQEIEDVFNPCFCGLFLIILITLCCLAFSGVMSWGHSADVIQAFTAYFAMLVCVFIFCRLGTELTAQAESVGDSAWGCDWVGTPVQFQRCLAFVIATAQKEFTLTAGKFVPVSNTTMMNMLNQSVSLFMFLLQMRERNDGEKEGK
ncbi:odorant receptor coreceptor-like isoform X1 [Zootermopsis nevadensis]|uniref:odorant receptor coreceptor-like isoform X1 n=1 Tax=Zootermopsis nevadensis TaxID=136037 RepID=UPI000B8E873A|nr:odorant receptor coreceptor-like isoform X1 [Zootermopsis nevadensis]